MTSQQKPSQTVQLPLDGGMDQRQHPKLLQPPSTLNAVNVRYTNTGAATKRSGTQQIASSFLNGYTMLAGAGKCFSFQDQVYVTDGFRLGALTQLGGGLGLIDKGKVPEAVSKMKSVASTGYLLAAPDTISNNNLIFHAFLGSTFVPNAPPASNTIYVTVEDQSTGAVVVDSQPASTGVASSWTPHLVNVSVSGVPTTALIWRDNIFGVGTNVYSSVFSTSTLTWSAPSVLIANVTSDIDVCSDGLNFYIVCAISSTIVVRKYSGAMSLIATINCSEAGAGFGLGVGICQTPFESVWISYTLTTGGGASVVVKAANYPVSLASETTPPFVVFTPNALVITSPVRISATQAVIAVSSVGSVCWFPVVSTAGAIVGNATAANRVAFWCKLGSRPFVALTSSPFAPLRVCAWVYSGGADMAGISGSPNLGPLQYTFTLIDLGADDTTTIPWVARPITWQASRFANTVGANNVLVFWPPCSAPSGSTDFVIRLNNRLRIGLARAKVDFGNPVTQTFAKSSKFVTCELGQSLFMTPGFQIDSGGCIEIGYNYFPQGLKVTAATSPAGTYGSGVTKTFKAMYEYVDGNGFVHRSNTSDAFSAVTAAAASSFQIQVPCLCITLRNGARGNDLSNGVRLVLYRLNTTTGFFERVFPEGQEPLNDPHQQFLTLTDTGAAGDPVPETSYTDTGVFPNVQPSGFTSCVTYRNRVWIAYGNTVAYSKAFVTGDAVNFTDAFQLPLEETGDITAMWKMDDTLFISTEQAIYYLQANGPNDFGQQNDIDTPNRVATDRGVVDQRSIAVTPVGTLYQSSVGIQHLDRGRNVAEEPIGARVQKDLATFPEISSTVVHPTGRYVSFSARNLTSGIRLVFDYALNKWSRDTLVNGVTDSGVIVLGEAVSKAGLSGSPPGGFVFFLYTTPSSNVISFENPNTNLDQSVWVPMLIDMAEIHPSGPQLQMGYDNWVLLNEWNTDHDIIISWHKDYEIASFQSTTFTSSQISSILASGLLEQFDLTPPNTDAQSMRITIQDAPPSGVGSVIGTGRGATFITLAVNMDPVAAKTMRVAASQQG